MSFVLRSISVYSKMGQRRTIEFRRSGLNILTGRSKTGKSSIVDILDYCLGRPECYVAVGVIRQHVSWFGVEIANGDDLLFLGRRNPDPDRNTSPDIYIRRGQHESLPEHTELHKNTTEDALVRLVSRFAGMAQNEHRPLTGTRRPLQATIRHALFLCFQKQDEIASRDRLFHRQGDPFIPQAIKDTIPYFLGAVDEEHFLRQNELDEAKRALHQLRGRRDAMESDETAGKRIQSVLLAARSVGFVGEDYESADDEVALAELKRIMTTDLRSPTIISGSSEAIVRLENELRALHRRLDDVQNSIRATKHFVREQSSYSREVGEQRARLVSLHLYRGESDADHICPLCEAELETPTPAAADLARSLSVLEQQLDAVVAERPHLQERLNALGTRRIEVERAIVSTQHELERAYADNERARLLRDQVIERARVIGRIGALLDEIDLRDERGDLDALIAEAQQRVDLLSERVNAEDIEERVFTFLNLIADRMTEYASQLDLEHAERRMRLDLKKLSVVAETVTGPIPLSRIGSGENWVGYHVVTFLALHRWFRERNRPVPGILVFDQPSQAHYPPDADRGGRIDGLQDADRRAVHKMFQFMQTTSKAIGDGFQLIVLDHAHLDEDWFNASLVEEWRGDAALIPVEWTEGM